VEQTRLFRRFIGELTDVVSNPPERCTASVAGRRELTLRPEATAEWLGRHFHRMCVQRHKLWCMGPMFRYETRSGPLSSISQVNLEAVGTRSRVDAS